jgi:hypothetical protein
MSERQTDKQVEQFILTEQDFRKLIDEKLERARLQAQVDENRRLQEFA